MEPLAKLLGVTRGGFHWHFADRDALLAEVLDAWERMSIDEVIEQVETGGGDPRTKVRRAGALAFSAELLPIDPAVAERLRRVDNRRMDYARSLFAAFCADGDEVEVRATIAFSLAVGNHFLAADHGARSRQEVLDLALHRVLLA